MAISLDNLFPKFLQHIHKKYRTPDYALVLQTILATILVFVAADFTTAASLSVLLVVITYFFSCFAVLKLIKVKNETLVLEGKVAPIVSIIACVLFMTQFQPRIWGLFIALILAGWVVYLLRKKKTRLIR